MLCTALLVTLKPFNTKTVGFWTIEQTRRLLEDYARRRGLDPRLPDTWYRTTIADIQQIKGGNTILRKTKGGLIAVLQLAFPNVSFDRTLFSFPKYVWTDIKERRRFFERYAAENGFDALVARNWYAQTRDAILSVKGARGVLDHHGGVLSAALLDLFPDVGFDESKLFAKKDVYENAKNRRDFFCKYAERNGIDPLNSKEWYTQTRERIMAIDGSRAVISYHKNSVSAALRDLFPEVSFDASPRAVTQNKWSDVKNRRSFFEQFAQERGFDPYNALHWYAQHGADIMAAKDANKVMYYYSNQILKALSELFPNIGLDKARLGKSLRSLTNTPKD